MKTLLYVKKTIVIGAVLTALMMCLMPFHVEAKEAESSDKSQKEIEWKGDGDDINFFVSKQFGVHEFTFSGNWSKDQRGYEQYPGENDIAIFTKGEKLPIVIQLSDGIKRRTHSVGGLIFKSNDSLVFDFSDKSDFTFKNGGVDNDNGHIDFKVKDGSTLTFNNMSKEGLTVKLKDNHSAEKDSSSESVNLKGSNAKDGTIKYSLEKSSELHFKDSHITGSKPESTMISCKSNSKVIFSNDACVKNTRIDADASTVTFDTERDSSSMALDDVVINAINSNVVINNEALMTNTQINIGSGGSLDFLKTLKSSDESVNVTLRSEAFDKRSQLNLAAHNVIGVLDVDDLSQINLDDYSLTVGKNRGNGRILGSVIGNADAKLKKVGTGSLEIGGDYRSFKGTTEVVEGTLQFANKIDLMDTSVVATMGGNIHFKDDSSAGSANILMDENSQLEFKDHAMGASAAVILKSNAQLKFNQVNSLGSLNTEENTVVDLDKHMLTIGCQNNSHSQLQGKLIGNSESQLMKIGSGDLQLTGDILDCNGTAVVKEGRIIFDNDVKFSNISADKGAILFDTKSTVNSPTINVSNGGQLEIRSSNSSTGNLNINCHSNSDVKFTGLAPLHNLQIDATDSNVSFALNENILVGANSGMILLSDSVINANHSTLSFGKHVGVTATKINVQSGGTLNLYETFEPLESDGREDVCISLHTVEEDKISKLNLFANNKIGSIDCDDHSQIDLNHNALQVGANNRDDQVQGKILGNEESALIKVGKGTLELGGSHTSFKGTTKVTDGMIKFSKNSTVDCAHIIAEGGDIHFTDNSSAGMASIEVLENSHLVFKDSSDGASASVKLKSNGVLQIQKNISLSSLNTETDAVVDLNQNSLTIGFKDDSQPSPSILYGKLKGSHQSQLIKLGAGDLKLLGDISDCKGIANVHEGHLILENTGVQFSEMIADGGVITFGEGSHANACKIKVCNGGMLELQGESGNQAKVELSSKGALNICQNNTLDSLDTKSESAVNLQNASLTVGHGDHSSVIWGDLIGEESSNLIKVGKGALHLAGDKSSFLGHTQMQGGTIHLKGSAILGGHVVLNESTKLKGRGTINKDLTVKSGGLIDLTGEDNVLENKTFPDLHVKGNLVLHNKSACHLKVNDLGKSSQIQVDGTASVDGSMQVDTSDGYLLCTSYKILEADQGVQGAFHSASVNKGNMKVAVDYLKDKVIEIRLEPDLVSVADTKNQKSAAHAVESMENPNGQTRLILDQLVDLSKKETPKVLSHISGEQYGNLALASVLSSSRFIRTIYTPLRFISLDQDCDELCYNEYKVWGDAGGGKSCKSGSNGYKLDEFNVTMTFQKSLNGLLTECCDTPNYIPCYWLTGWTAGIALGYSNEHYDFNLDAETTLHKGQVALYALLTKSWYYALFDLAFGYSQGKFEREIKFRKFHHRAHSDIDIFQTTFYGELGLNSIYWKCIAIQPYVGIELDSFCLSSLKEHGVEPLNLKIGDHHSLITSSYLGVHTNKSLDIDNSWTIAVDLAWRHLFGYNDHLKERFAAFGNRFEIREEQIGENAFQGAFSIFKAINDAWIVNGEVSGEKWGSYSSYELSLGLSYSW